MSLPQLTFTIHLDKPVEAQASSWKSLRSLNMQGNGYVKIIATYYNPKTEEEAPRNTTLVVPAARRNLSVSREVNIFSNYVRLNLSEILVDRSFAALAASTLNSQQERLIEMTILGWVDYHRS